MAREIINKIQKLRKATGINIDDLIEVYYKSDESSQLNSVLTEHFQSINSALRVPFLKDCFRQPHYVKVADTEYANPDNEKDVI